MRKFNYFVLGFIVWLMTGCGGSNSSVNSEPEPPITETNANANEPIEGKSFVTDYSMPHLNPDNYYVEHTVTYDGKKILNYAYEWVKEKKHTAWVAYSFDETTSKKNVSRSDDAWAVDLELPGGWCPEESNHKSDGFDKATSVRPKTGCIRRKPMNRHSITAT